MCLQEGFAQDRDFRLGIEFLSAFPREFLGTEAVGGLFGMLVERGSSGICAPLPHRSFSPLAAATLFHKPHRQRPGLLEFVRKQHKPLTLLPSLFSASSSLDLVWGDQLLPEVPRPIDIAEPNPQDQGGSGKRWRYSSGSYRLAFKSPRPQPLSVQMARLWGRQTGFQLSFLGASFFLLLLFFCFVLFCFLSKSRFLCPQSEGENSNFESR